MNIHDIQYEFPLRTVFTKTILLFCESASYITGLKYGVWGLDVLEIVFIKACFQKTLISCFHAIKIYKMFKYIWFFVIDQMVFIYVYFDFLYHLNYLLYL